jgi:hypothetical protein
VTVVSASSYFEFFRIGFAPLLQILEVPLSPMQFLSQDPLGLLLAGFLPFRSTEFRSWPEAHLEEKFLAEWFAPNAPTLLIGNRFSCARSHWALRGWLADSSALGAVEPAQRRQRRGVPLLVSGTKNFERMKRINQLRLFEKGGVDCFKTRIEPVSSALPY